MPSAMDHPTTLASLEPDTFAAVCSHLAHREVAALAASCAALRHAVGCNDRLWASLYQRQFPQPWALLTQRQAPRQGQQQAGSSGVAPGAWRETFLRTHQACHQLASTDPQCREWTTDASAVHLAAIHGSGRQRLTLTAQGSGVELRCAPDVAPDKSFQLYGHTARVSSAAVLHPAGFGAAAVQRIGVVTGSHDQTVRLWAGNCDPESWEFRSQPLSLLTPLRTLRGHQEAVTALQLMTSNTGVTIAATGSKDRTVRLWGLAPLVPSPVHKPGIATLRGHGAPITCLAVAGGSLDGSGSSASSSSRGAGSSGGSPASGSWLLSGSLDARVKQWDAFHGSCIGTAKCGMPVAACQPAAAAPELQPHTLLVSGGTQVQLMDLRCLRPVAGVAVPAERGEAVHCFCQWGWDLAVGSSDGARVFDIRQLPTLGSSSSAVASSAAAAAAAAAGAGRGAPERLRLVGHARPVTSIHVDRLKVVTATDRYSPAPVRVWCAVTGEPLAELDSCLPPAQPQAGPQPESAEGAGWEGDHELGQQPGDPAAAPAAGPAAGPAEGGSPVAAPGRPAHQYHRGWEGVAALVCCGALLVSGSSEGSVVERDFSRGGVRELEPGEAWSAGAVLAGKFWQHASLG